MDLKEGEVVATLSGTIMRVEFTDNVPKSGAKVYVHPDGQEYEWYDYAITGEQAERIRIGQRVSIEIRVGPSK